MDHVRMHADDPPMAIEIHPFSISECHRRRTCLCRAWVIFHSHQHCNRSHRNTHCHQPHLQSIHSSIYRWILCRMPNRMVCINGIHPHQILPVHSFHRICRHGHSDRIDRNQRTDKIRKLRTWKDRIFSMDDRRTFTYCPIWTIMLHTVHLIHIIQIRIKRRIRIRHQILIKHQTRISHRIHTKQPHHNTPATRRSIRNQFRNTIENDWDWFNSIGSIRVHDQLTTGQMESMRFPNFNVTNL